MYRAALIADSLEETHASYDECALRLLQHPSKPFTVLATHNVSSAKRALHEARGLGIDPRDPRLQFAQLKGMADALSLALAATGNLVSKYMPFGRVQVKIL